MNPIIIRVRFRAPALILAALGLFLFSAATASAAPNLIANPGVEASTTLVTLPNNWAQGGYGLSSSTFNYQGVAGHMGKGVSVTLANYVSGDAKWIFDPITIVDAGAYYTFTDWYKSSVPSRLVAALTGDSVPDIYITIATLPSSNDTWVQATQTFTPYLGYSKVTIYHLIEANGTLTTDDYSLEVTAPSAQNLFPQGLVSITFDDGWKSQYDTALPILTSANLKATFYLIGKAISQAVANPSAGYFTPANMIDLANKGHEISAHTESHCNLRFLQTGLNGTNQPTDSTDLNTCAFPETGLTWQGEIATGTATLVVQGATTTISNFAYPNGATNPTIKSYVQGLGYTSARTVDEGYNTKQSDLMALKVEVVDANTTYAQVKGWIDTAIANKFWLVLVFHQINNPATLISNGEQGGTTPQTFQNIVSYLATQPAGPAGSVVKTVKEVLSIMGINPSAPADTSAPVIVRTGSASTSVTVGTPYTDAGATATDQPGNTSVAVVTTVTFGATTTTSVNTNVVGTYVVHYNAHDTATPANQATEVTRTVNVVAVSAPVSTTPLVSVEQKGSVTTNSVTITWTTDHAATSRVVWGTASVLSPVASSTMATGTDLYGYQHTTAEADTAPMVIAHSVTVSGLTEGTTYFFRPISHSSPEALGSEITVTTATTPAPATPPSSGGGSSGGGGGGGIVGSGPLSLGYVYVNQAGPITTTPSTGSVLGAATCFVFTKNLTVSSTGAEVTALQNRLSAEGLFTAGATAYFGNVTRASVMAFQKKNGIAQLGNTGPKTRAALNVCATAPAAPTATSTGSVLGASTFIFTKNLTLGSSGLEVNELQKVLIGLGFLKVAAPTGYFGSLTKVGVADYQMSRGIETVGTVGPKTRAALNGNQAAVQAEK